MSATLRRRRGTDAPNDDVGVSDEAGKKRPLRVRGDRGSGTPNDTFTRAFFVLLLARLASAFFNLIHDCDETYNFWEPLHYLTHGVGFQTWEHSPEFGLRSYFYLGAHGLIAKPVAWLVGVSAPETTRATARAALSTVTRIPHARLVPFYAVRVVFALVSAFADASLTSAVSDVHPLAGSATLASLALSAGCFVYSTSFLPSTFAGVCVTFAATCNLKDQHARACAWCVAAVAWGWPFAGVAAAPFGVDCLRKLGVARTLLRVAVPLVAAVACSVAADTYFYGRLTCSAWNIVKYNVFPDVKSEGANLYGTEPFWFYFKNLTLNFAHGFPLALLGVPVSVLASTARFGRDDGSRRSHLRLVPAQAAFLFSLLLFSSLKHKEERFMYVAYSCLCVGTGSALGASFDLCVAFAKRNRSNADDAVSKANQVPKGFARRAGSGGPALYASIAVGCSLLTTAALGSSRVAALISGYAASTRAYAEGLPATVEVSTNASLVKTVCVGDKWFQFPSSFHLPHSAYRVRFLRGGFHGALPVPFSEPRGGTAFAPEGLNDRNVGEDVQRISLEEARITCDFVVEYVSSASLASDDGALEAPYLGKPRFANDADEPSTTVKNASDGSRKTRGASGSVSDGDDAHQGSRWKIIWEAPFLDAENTPALLRAFLVPWRSSRRRAYGAYRVYQKLRAASDETRAGNRESSRF
jgi:alpha-1,2-mannosyltransferase